MDTLTKENELDQEWVELILQAKEKGLSLEEIREFINQFKRPE